MQQRVLITGGSIAGGALAFWLIRAGYHVTVQERAPAFRTGGQNVDVRGAGRQVLRHMRLEEAVAALSTGESGIAFVDEHNDVVAQFDESVFGDAGWTAELEVLRGDLAELLHAMTKDHAVWRFGDRVTAICQGAGHATVEFESGRDECFDLVIIAEGIGSSTRKAVFGDAVKRRPLDLYMGYFTIPRGEKDGKLARWYNAPRGRSVLLRPDNGGTARVVLTLQTPPQGYENLTSEQQKRVLTDKFADAGWETQRVLDGLATTDDFYFEAIGQVKMDRWSDGRVVLVGDAAWCASPISGMGTSLALVGAYVLAGELTRHSNFASAFTAYERIMRPYVDQAQGVPKFATRIAQPQTRFGISLQQTVLNIAAKPGVRALTRKFIQTPADQIDLPPPPRSSEARGA